MSKLFLLSEEEYLDNEKYIQNDVGWWLRTPDDFEYWWVKDVGCSGMLVHDKCTTSVGVRPAFKFKNGISHDVHIGDVIKFGKLEWIKLRDGLYLSKEVLFDYPFNNIKAANIYETSSIKDKLKEWESWWFTENELSMLEDF